MFSSSPEAQKIIYALSVFLFSSEKINANKKQTSAYAKNIIIRDALKDKNILFIKS
jgi:hypothetical protein